MHINKIKTYHRLIYLLIHIFTSHVEVKVFIYPHRCLNGFCILGGKLLKYVLSVFCFGW
jgi:hypothetical protein